MNQYNAARAAGYSENMARKHPERLEKAVKGGILEALEQVGITDKYQAKQLFELSDHWDSTVRLNTLKHIADLKAQVKDKGVNLNQNTTVINQKDRVVIFRDIKDELNGNDISPDVYARQGAEGNISQETL
jgi:hypothetical protein